MCEEKTFCVKFKLPSRIKSMRLVILLMFFSFSTYAFEQCVDKNLKNLESCSLNNYKEEDKKLNYLYKSLINVYPELKENIKKTQKAWIKARDDICKYTLIDGKEYQVYQNACLHQQTYERIRELKAIFLKQTSLENNENLSDNMLWETYLNSHCEFMLNKYNDIECKNRNKFLHSQ